MTFEEYQDSITAKQDELTDLLLELRKEEGEAFVKQFLRMAIVNYVAEATGAEEGEDLFRETMSIADAITTPCYLHQLPPKNFFRSFPR